ncbi:hypothetical protein A6U98_27160 [Rhizobium sp. WYCCWR10014]|uniref:DUF6161 domain-containing protein n=1 Tax=Rhizobium sp. WYCCWR10014 TaxID=1825933 RepID=UPI0007F51FC5|nr:DUF6161 domain-containing protein [Rhizobium sp. WYCCWR10014]OAV52477.1 hypothetical protein A6U98_27160 [Rhizobium sp. WYCCWR10014]
MPDEIIIQDPQATPPLVQIITIAIRYVSRIEKEGDLAGLLGTLQRSTLKGGKMMRPQLNVDNVRDFGPRFESAFDHASPEEQVELIISLIAALVAETKYHAFGIKFADTRFGIPIQAEIASYEAWKTAKSRFSGFDKAVSRVLEQQAQQVEKFSADSAHVLQAASNEVIELQSRTADAIKRISDEETRFSASLDSYGNAIGMAKRQSDQAAEASQKAAEIASTAEGNISAFKSAVLEATKIDTARKLWDRRATINAIAFWCSAAVICAFLIVIPVVALYHLDQVLAILGHVMQTTLIGFNAATLSPAALTAIAINRVVVVTVPIALYFWIVRLLVRYNMRAQMLLDDARQRHTMLDTYFHLIEKDAATKTDRALVLNALFRPTPGQQSEAVEPPNFTELLEKAVSKG